MKQAIKEIIKAGGSVGFDMKHSIDSWFGTIRIYPLRLDWEVDPKTEYFIDPYAKSFDDIDEAIDFFVNKAFTSENVGYIQNRLRDKGVDFENEFNLENPTKELRKLFKAEGKLVDEEFKNKFGTL